MVKTTNITDYVNKFLDVDNIDDFCLNGLQVEGSSKIGRLVTGVSANLELIEASIKEQADAIIVHHGYFWKKQLLPMTGIHGARIKMLLMNNINLFCYHLPLDVHPSIGNNVQLACALDLECASTLNTNTKPNLGIICKDVHMSTKELINKVASKLMREPLVLGMRDFSKLKIAICTGAGQSFIEQAKKQGANVFISGESSEQTTHLAKELGITYIAAGHHATERYGVQALGEHLSHIYDIKHTFIDIDNPV